MGVWPTGLRVEYWWLLPRGAAAPFVLDFFVVFLLVLPGMSMGACECHFMLLTVLNTLKDPSKFSFYHTKTTDFRGGCCPDARPRWRWRFAVVN